MKLLLRRDQKSGMLGVGKITFTLAVRAELTDEEKNNIRKYKLGDEVLYSRGEFKEKSNVYANFASIIAFRMLNLSISVDDLEKGKRVDCKDIVEMLAVEEQIKEAAQTFKAVLEAAASFGGEEVIELK